VRLAERLERAGYETWAVGGALRDLLLGLEVTDVDLATAAPPEVVRQLFRRTVAVGLKYGTVGVLDREHRLHEVTTFRRDVVTDGRHAVVEFGGSLADDLARRDFTINAIAFHPLRREWADPFGGLADLRAGIIRAVGTPTDRFREDYLRILRALRFAARFGFAIEPATWAAAVELAPGLVRLSAERVRDEWFKGLETARSVAEFCALWREVGAARVWLPELYDHYPGGDPAPTPRDAVVLTALVCRDPGRVLERLRGSNAEQARARALGAGPHQPASPSEADVRRWLHTVGPHADDLLLLARYRAGRDSPPPAWTETVQAVRARGDPVSRSALAVTGDDLLALGFPPGPAVGAALDRLLSLVLEDPSRNTRERLLEAARAWR
jgi:tRNA nucleotidyltransferase (CCA-adding enzyme)